MIYRTRGNRLLRRAERVAGRKRRASRRCRWQVAGCRLQVAGVWPKVRGVAIRVAGLISIIVLSLASTFCTRPLTQLNAFANDKSVHTFRNGTTLSNRHRQPETGNVAKRAAVGRQPFLSEQYNHFEGGKLFTDVREGLDVMWHASFKSGKPYKENLGFILPEGLLVSPNKGNTSKSAQLSVYPKWVENGKLLLLYNGNIYEVLAIVHTHPLRTLTEPTPRKDFQYCFMGIHNFVISHHHIYDAWKDKNGNEIFRRIGKRTEYERLMAVVRSEFAHLSLRP